MVSANHRVVLIEPPCVGINRGMSSWPLLDEQMAIALNVLDALGIPSCHWVGHGYGGLVGAGLAVRRTARLRSLTLASVPFVQKANVILFSGLMAKLLYSSILGRSVVSHYVSQQIASTRGSERALVKAHFKHMMQHSNLDVLKTLQPAQPSLTTPLRNRLQKIDLPVMVVAGRYDTVVLPRDQRTLSEVLVSARYHEVDSGFMTHLVQPAMCAQLFEQFVHDIESTSKPGALNTVF